MKLAYLEHVNMRTANLAAMRRFYQEVLGLTIGYRPPFTFGGAWLYCGDRPAVHLVEVERPKTGDDPRLEHFAFRAEDFRDFIAHLEGRKIEYWISHVPEIDLCQVNVRDPDGNHVEVGFAAAEKNDFAPYLDRAQSNLGREARA